MEPSGHAAADPGPVAAHVLSTNIAAFCAVLRNAYGFRIGHAEAHDALRALEAMGIVDERRVRSALRLVCCGTREQRPIFERAFDAFFRPAANGIAQASYVPRHSRAGPQPPPLEREDPAKRRAGPVDDAIDGEGGKPVEHRVSEADADDATAWQMLRARLSPMAASAAPPMLSPTDSQAMLAAADHLIARLQFGLSRRWERADRGRRFDLRRTIRLSLQTGGEPVELRYLARPKRQPRFVVLIDGSRSISEQATPMVEFARALCRRSQRAHAFFFSTELGEVTRHFRAVGESDASLDELGEAWGGGTKIGANLDAFVARHGARLLSPDTVVIIFSDGLDAGDLPQLERALREIERRSAGIVWLNPHAASPRFKPTARAMRAALPFLNLLASADEPAAFAALGDRLARTWRLR